MFKTTYMILLQEVMDRSEHNYFSAQAIAKKIVY